MFTRPLTQKEKLQQFVNKHSHDLAIHEFEKTGEQNALRCFAQRETARAMAVRRSDLDHRRDRLHLLMSQEEEDLKQALMSLEETPEVRKANMLNKLNDLKLKREAERKAFVEEKRNQQFMNNTAELRPILSKKIQNEISIERVEQLRLKEQLLQEDVERERMFAELWRKDAEAKAFAEEERAARVLQRNKETQRIILEQIRQLNERRSEKRKLILEEAELMREQRRIMQLEDQYLAARRKRRQMRHKQVLDRELVKKLARVHREIKEEIELEKKLLDDIMSQGKDDAAMVKEQAERKKRLWDEQQRYRKYLEEQAEKARQEEKDLERMLKADNDAMWERREREWRMWEQARDKLRCDCISGTYEIIQDHLAKNREQQLFEEEQAEQLKKSIEENMKLEIEAKEADKAKKAQYKQDLIGQMTYQNNKLADQLAELHREWAQSRKEEEEFKKQLQKELTTPLQDQIHPYRRTKMEWLKGDS